MKTVALLCLCFVCFSYSLANSSVEDVYENLWLKNKDIANKTIGVDFLRQMEKGSLQAERYVKFTIQDISYLLKVTDMLKKMSITVMKPDDLRDFMKNRYSSYKRFADSMLNQYFFKGEPAIQQTPAMKKYLSFYRELMKGDPLYFAVGLLPCSRLWVWLANNLNIPPTNAYYTWMSENKNGHPEKHYKALLNKYLNTPEKVVKANTVFRTQMQNEHDFFFTS
ncbi:uncharacterized protein si:ch1073-67j19.1 isoform X1 [Xyrauchen texanus]|uniref:uncharacterized protein si:ch1073-67j19.1 isoform X1 n=1 Tax=Xyrauchen texanus TaxID=154827 RepID=UPI002242A5EC|nr:uncharacterized protein si:ch1073-67j19.1 isoform X1 [Xyrauchen texanus]